MSAQSHLDLTLLSLLFRKSFVLRSVYVKTPRAPHPLPTRGGVNDKHTNASVAARDTGGS